MTEPLTRGLQGCAAQLSDSRSLLQAVGDAAAVGIGITVRGARETAELNEAAHRIVRTLVSEAGFGALALELDSPLAEALDAHVRSGSGDPAVILRDAFTPYATEEFLAVIQWLRSHAVQQPDRAVRILGLDTDATGDPMDADANFARVLRDWLPTGIPVVSWGGAAHTARGDLLAPRETSSRRPAGARLAGEIGHDYRSIGLTLGESPAPRTIPEPPADFVEHALGRAGKPSFLLDLGCELPDAVRAFVHAPAKVRLVGPAFDPARQEEWHMSGGSLADWFDVLVHQQRGRPATALKP